MERRITRHSSRLSAAHEAALDPQFKTGQRVRTLDGFTGRVLFVTEAFAPGTEAYQIQLDGGSGGGTYLASQLRPVPEGYGGGAQAPANLPAGVTAALEAEADLDARTAADWYPEMGDVLTERPDPGREIKVIGSRRQALGPQQLKLFHMDRDPSRPCPQCGTARDSWMHGDDHTAWRSQNDPDYEPDECEHCGGDLNMPEHHGQQHQDWLGEQKWHTDWDQEGPGPVLHRGMSMALPAALHEHVHDESVPVRERAHALLSHVLRDQSEGSAHGGLGNFWSDDEDVSKSYAENTHIYRKPDDAHHEQTPVMIHVHTPPMEHIETDPDTLDHWGVHSYHIEGNREVPLQNQAPLRVKGISWASPDHGLSAHRWSGVPEHLDEDPAWKHHDFEGEGIQAHAAQYAEDYDARDDTYNGEPGVAGIYWQQPAQQQFIQSEHLDQTEEPMAPVMPMASLHPEPSHVLYHGTRAELKPGDWIEPGHKTNFPDLFGHSATDEEGEPVVYATRSREGAGRFAEMARGNGRPRVYHVEPEDPEDLEEDPEEVVNGPGNSIAPGSVRSRFPLRVVREATTINGTQIDDHGDAPDHGLRPRATDPDAYDRQSTEGHGDSKWDDAMAYDGMTAEEVKRNHNGAAIGMYPEGVYAGGGPGISVGPVVARVPWTGHERTELHSWQSGNGANEGDFVPSKNFTNRMPEYVPEPDPSDMIMMEAADWGAPPDPADRHGGDGPSYHPYQHLSPSHWDYPRTPEEGSELHPWDAEPEDVATEGQHSGHERRYQVMHTLSGRHSFPEETPAGQHLMHAHGWGAEHVRNTVERGNRPSDIHDALHETGMTNHEHTGDPRHEQELTSRFGPERPVDERAVSPYRGGTPIPRPLGDMLMDSLPLDAGGMHAKMPFGKLNALVPEVIGPRAFTEHIASGAIAEAVYRQLSEDYPPEAIEWVRHASWTGPHFVPFDQVDWAGRRTWSSYHQPERVDHFVKRGVKKARKGKTLNPSILIAPPGGSRQRIGDGHHRALACLVRAVGGEEAPPGVWGYTASVDAGTGPWDEMHDKQFHADSERKGGEETGTVPGPDGSPEERTQFQQQVEEGVQRFGDAETSDVSAPSLNADKTGRPLGENGTHKDKTRQGRDKGAPRGAVSPAADAPPIPPMSQGGTRKQRKAVLRAFEQAAGDAGYRFEFTASWRDVQAKAKRMRAEGKVRIVMARNSLVIGEVEGDHATYESGIQTYPGRPGSVMAYACGCPWATFHQDESQPGRFNGRMCSHALAVRYEASSKGMFGRAVTEDERKPGWLPHDIVVRSEPPYEGDPHKGRWRQQWLAPAASRTAAAGDSPWMRPPWSPEELGEHLYHQHGWSRDKVSQVGGKERWRQHVQEHQWGTVDNAAGRWQERTVSHQHDFPRGTEGEGSWPDVFRLSDHTDFAGGTPSPHRWENLMNGQSKPFEPLPPHMSRFMTVDEARDACRADPVYQAARILLGHGEDTRQVAALMALAGADPDALIRRHMEVAHAEGLGGKQFPAGMDAHAYHALLHEKGAAAKMPHRHEEREAPDPAQQPGLRAVKAASVPDWIQTQRRDRGICEQCGEQPSATTWAGTGQDICWDCADKKRAAREGALLHTADQANAPWGSNNYVNHPPAKPYGATSPPEKDRDPGSYGPLAGPDPDNWGEIQDGSAVQMPLSNEAAFSGRTVEGPDTLDWIPEHQDSFPYADQAATAGPSTSITPHDPGGIRMEEGLRDLQACAVCGLIHHASAGEPQLGGALAEKKDEPDAALDPDGLTGASDGTIGGGSSGAAGPDDWGAASPALLSSWGAVLRNARGNQLVTDPSIMSSMQQGGAQHPDENTGQNPGMGSWDEPSAPDDSSIQTIGNQQWSGGGADSDEVAAEPGMPQGEGGVDSIIAAFQRSAAASRFAGSGGDAAADGDIAAAARQFLSRTAEVLAPEEADELIREGKGAIARNLDMLDLKGTHYTDAPELDEHDDDVLYA